jgi:hypothetical protein
MAQKAIKRTTSALLSVLIAACGGGGGDDSGTAGTSGTSQQTTSSAGTSSSTAPASTGNPGSGTTSSNNAPSGNTGSGTSSSGETGAPGSTSPALSAYAVDATARFTLPGFIKSDAAGNLFVLDAGTKIRKVSASGDVTTLPVTLTAADGLVIDSAGNLYTNDAGAIRKIAQDGTSTTLATIATKTWMTIDPEGNLYVLSIDPAGVQAPAVLKVAQDGSVTTLFSGEPLRNPMENSTITYPIFGSQGIARDAAGNLYVGDRTEIWKFPSSGMPTLFASGLNMPSGGVQLVSDLAVDNSGNVYVAMFSPASGESSICGIYGVCWGGVDFVTGIYKIRADGSVESLMQDTPHGAIPVHGWPIASKPGTPPVEYGRIAQQRFGAMHIVPDYKGGMAISYSRDYTIYQRLNSGSWVHLAGKSIEPGSAD